ncbi:DUF4398 domain-containing protein [Marilutibacter chinensis]|uniref:DUF4398 domain-containing protein n=1 Tax=Marilutibacter chinensis TaxID=2912247 RepID=A0ABS9HQW3_9GAMM|nr:DUF4398 domain-containing protein [Lysobacter chinensis]MCF7221326.1 DUF4398 domain-containing protein [Lysobacter chinensis]
MTPSFAYFRGLLMAAVLASVLTACASLPPPTAELAAAQQAVVTASDADADQYAARDIANAREALSRAQAAMAEGRDADARKFALAASADAELAGARSEQARLTAQVAQRRAEITELQRRLGQEDRR